MICYNREHIETKREEAPLADGIVIIVVTAARLGALEETLLHDVLRAIKVEHVGNKDEGSHLSRGHGKIHVLGEK